MRRLILIVTALAVLGHVTPAKAVIQVDEWYVSAFARLVNSSSGSATRHPSEDYPVWSNPGWWGAHQGDSVSGMSWDLSCCPKSTKLPSLRGPVFLGGPTWRQSERSTAPSPNPPPSSSGRCSAVSESPSAGGDGGRQHSVPHNSTVP